MYGTVARIRIKAGQKKAVGAVLGEWNKDRRPKAEGALPGAVVQAGQET